uniref:Uncharacterized protein n=1 Tax=Oryza sativa subsp. japonica TaxID=39947 RepID=Q6Z7U6_ORYSJ|nr:hypothetical protein [Oryza sativa Japonica Group]
MWSHMSSSLFPPPPLFLSPTLQKGKRRRAAQSGGRSDNGWQRTEGWRAVGGASAGRRRGAAGGSEASAGRWVEQWGGRWKWSVGGAVGRATAGTRGGGRSERSGARRREIGETAGGREEHRAVGLPSSPSVIRGEEMGWKRLSEGAQSSRNILGSVGRRATIF